MTSDGKFRVRLARGLRVWSAWACFWAVTSTASATVSPQLTSGNEYSRSTALPRSMSGLTYAGGNTYYTIAESSGASGNVESWCLHKLSITLDDAGTRITGAKLEGSVAVEACRDLEAVAFDPVSGNVWCTDETAKTIGEYDPATGKRIRFLSFPDFLKDSYGGYWFEGLTISGDGLTMWAANEEALKCDDTRSSYQKGTTVRLVKFTRATAKDDWQCVAMHPYTVDKWHNQYSYGSAGRRGISDLVALPDGSLLVMERELSSSAAGTGTWAGFCVTLYLSIYRVTPEAMSAAPNVKDVPSLLNRTVSAVSKTSLWSDGVTWNNYEGFCLGPRISASQCAVLAVTDAGDSDMLSMSMRPFVLSGLNVHTLEFSSPAYGTSSIVGKNFRFLNGDRVEVALGGTVAKSPYATDGTPLADCRGWTLSNHSPGAGTGAAAAFTVAADGVFAWQVTPVSVTNGYHVVDSFEQDVVGSKVETLRGWQGEKGAVESRSYTPPTPPGYVMTRETHTRVLNVDDGVAIRSLAGSDENRIDTMVCFTPSGGTLDAVPEDERIRLSAGPDSRLYLWHRYAENGLWKKGWIALSERTYAAGEWMRVEMDFARSGDGELVRIRINGSCQPTAHGVRSPSDRAPYGAWHYLACEGVSGDRADSGEIVFMGTKVDDLMLCKQTIEPEHTGTTSVDGIDFAWFDAAGLPRDPTLPAPFVEGYTLGDIHTAGMDPYSTRPFEVTRFAVQTDHTALVEFNGYRGDRPTAFQLVHSTAVDFAEMDVLTAADGTFQGDARKGTTTWTGTLPAAGSTIGFIKVKALK